MTWEEKYIQDSIKNLNKYQKLVIATEHFANLMNFLKIYRKYNNLKLKIGYVEYDDWSADLYCILDEKKGIYFKHIIKEENREFINKTLTEQLIYAWGFDHDMLIDINFDIINDYWKILNNTDKKKYDSLRDDTHCMFW